VPVILAGVLVTLLVMLVLAVAPVVAGVSLVLRLAGKRAAPVKPIPAERLLRRPLSTGALIAWLVIPLSAIGLWATADALTEGGGRAQPTMTAFGVPGVWKTSGAAMVIFTADGRFTETNLPDPPADDAAYAGLTITIPRSAAGTWQFDSLAPGDQGVDLTFASGTYLGLDVTWRAVTGGHGHFVLQLYTGSSADLNPAYQLIRRGGA
jgi:hypothetical protein